MFEMFKDRIIVIEGPDGTGKDTISDLLQKKLENSIVVRFPNRSNRSGKIIDAVLRKQLPMQPEMFQSIMLVNKIETLCELERTDIKKSWYIFCRYYQSAYVYGLNDGLPLFWSQEINSVLPASKIVFVLYGKNYGHHEEYYEQDETQQRIARYYKELAEEYRNWVLVDNHKKPEEIASDILNHINQL